MRDSLAAPVKGLGLAFGTSVAGVAASALLGLMSALCRRERALVAQRLDALHRRPRCAPSAAPTSARQSLRLQQQQARAVAGAGRAAARGDGAAAVADRAGATRSLLASQQKFQQQAEAAYQALAASVGRSLEHSLSEGARIAAATIQPLVETTMGGITRETAALHGHIASTVAQQLDGLSARFDGHHADRRRHLDQRAGAPRAQQRKPGPAPGQHARRLRPNLRAALGRVGGCGGRQPCGIERASRQRGDGPARRRVGPPGPGPCRLAGPAGRARRAAAGGVEPVARRDGGAG